MTNETVSEPATILGTVIAVAETTLAENITNNLQESDNVTDELLLHDLSDHKGRFYL